MAYVVKFVYLKIFSEVIHIRLVKPKLGQIAKAMDSIVVLRDSGTYLVRPLYVYHKTITRRLPSPWEKKTTTTKKIHCKTNPLPISISFPFLWSMPL